MRRPPPSVDPMGDPGVHAVVGLPRRQDRPADALLRADAQRQPVDGRLRQPQPGRSAAGAQLEVPDAPSGSRSAGRAPRRAAGSRGDSPGPSTLCPSAWPMIASWSSRRCSRIQRATRRAQVPADAPEVAQLGVGRVRLVRDPVVPVVCRRRGWVARDAPRERVLARRLVEVPVDGEAGGPGVGAGAPAVGRRRPGRSARIGAVGSGARRVGAAASPVDRVVAERGRQVRLPPRTAPASARSRSARWCVAIDAAHRPASSDAAGRAASRSYQRGTISVSSSRYRAWASAQSWAPSSGFVSRPPMAQPLSLGPALVPPAVEHGAVDDAVHGRLHAAGAGRLEGPPRVVEPDVDALDQVAARRGCRSPRG